MIDEIEFPHTGVGDDGDVWIAGEPESGTGKRIGSGEAWAQWFARLGALATAEVVNATATLAIAEREAYLKSQGSGDAEQVATAWLAEYESAQEGEPPFLDVPTLEKLLCDFAARFGSQGSGAQVREAAERAATRIASRCIYTADSIPTMADIILKEMESLAVNVASANPDHPPGARHQCPGCGYACACNRWLRKDKEKCEHWCEMPTEELEPFAAEMESLAVPSDTNGWYCSRCQRGVPPVEVTFEEAHTICGTFVDNVASPERRAGADELPRHLISCADCPHVAGDHYNLTGRCFADDCQCSAYAVRWEHQDLIDDLKSADAEAYRRGLERGAEIASGLRKEWQAEAERSMNGGGSANKYRRDAALTIMKAIKREAEGITEQDIEETRTPAHYPDNR